MESPYVTVLREQMLEEFNRVFSERKQDSLPRFDERFDKRVIRLTERWRGQVALMKQQHQHDLTLKEIAATVKQVNDDLSVLTGLG
jgi:hypothetical protein